MSGSGEEQEVSTRQNPMELNSFRFDRETDESDRTAEKSGWKPILTGQRYFDDI